MSNMEVVHKCSIVGLGGAVSIIGIDQIETYLGIALIGIQIALVLGGLIFKLVKVVKSKQPTASDAILLVEEANDRINDLKNQLDEVKKRRGING